MRLHSMDAMRGIAILGILFMNIPFHVNMLTGYSHFDPPLSGDQIISIVQAIFADGRFRTLFCLLFGAGLAVQYEQCKRLNRDPKLFIKTRLNWLLLFGFIHALFVFGGDVLMFYALCGLFIRSRLEFDNDKLLRSCKRFIIGGCIVVLMIFALLLIISGPDDYIIRGTENWQEQVDLWNSGYLAQMLSQAGIAASFLLATPVSILWQTLGIMMLGAWLYRIGFFINGFTTEVFRVVTVGGIFLTLASIIPLVFDSVVLEHYISIIASIAALFMALTYAHLIVRWKPENSWLYKTLCNCGRMAFSLYLLQSLCMALLFRALMPLVYPQFEATVTRTDLFIIAVLFAGVQMVVANFVVNRFGTGPFEKLWRYCYLRSFNKKSEKAALTAVDEPPLAK